MRLAVALVVLGACGRLDFNVGAGASDGGSGASLTSPCGITAATPTPATVTITGQTYIFTDFINDRAAVPNVTVTASTPTLGDTVTTSDASGNYSLTIATGGVAQPVTMTYAAAGYFTTVVQRDELVYADVMSNGMGLFDFGDGAMWSGGGMGSVYGSVSLTVDSSDSTFNVEARDCSGTPLDGVTLALAPTNAQLFGDIGSNGYIDTTATATSLPYAAAVGFNQPPGLLRVTPGASGLRFGNIDIAIGSGDLVTLLVVHPWP